MHAYSCYNDQILICQEQFQAAHLTQYALLCFRRHYSTLEDQLLNFSKHINICYADRCIDVYTETQTYSHRTNCNTVRCWHSQFESAQPRPAFQMQTTHIMWHLLASKVALSLWDTGKGRFSLNAWSQEANNLQLQISLTHTEVDMKLQDVECPRNSLPLQAVTYLHPIHGLQK